MFWTNESLKSPLAFDTETELIKDELTIPTLSIMTVSDGAQSFAVHPDDVPRFLQMHARHRWYGYNAAFDYWVLDRHSRVLREAANEGRMTCLRLLRRLIKLATIGDPERRGTLADCCREYEVPEPDKSDPYRLRYGELIGLTKEQILAHPEASGFLRYAIYDAETTFALIRPMEEHAARLSKKYQKQFHPDAARRFGLLSVAIQTRADIVLAHLSRQPLHVDKEKLEKVETETRERIAELEEMLQEGCPGIWQCLKRTGQRSLDKKTGRPKMTQKVVRAKLDAIAREHQIAPIIKTDKRGRELIALEAERWAKYVKDDWVDLWHEYAGLRKRHSVWLVPMLAGTVYSKYETLMSTGRTSAGKVKGLPSVPIQQAPRDAEFRALFVAEPGMMRATIDYAYLELRTLAACCLVRFGKSVLADAVRRHTDAARKGRKDVPDPHEITASYVLGIEPDAFLRLPKERRKETRQKAKAVNFGCPGGLGVARLVDYAKAQYSVTLSEDEARSLKERWLEAYPEMRDWLGDNTAQNLAQNLGVSERCVRQYLGNHLWHARECIEGQKTREQAEPILQSLREMVRSASLRDLLSDFDHEPESYQKLARATLKGVATVPTGRIRARVGYTDGANTPFQGLASDGAKEALWRLFYAGYKITLFCHDEIVIDAPAGHVGAVKKRAHEIMDQAMQDVMGNGVPSLCESHVGPCWIKG